MFRALHSIACHEYGVAAVVYLAYLIRQWKVLPVVGRVLVASGLVLHGAALWAAVMAQGGMPLGLAQGLSSLAFLALAMFLALDLRYRVPVIGAFLVPLALTVMVPGLLVGEAGVSTALRRPLLPLHITAALLGVAAFAVAAGVAVMYLLMERQVKERRFGLLFSRLPPLQFLDELNYRLVVGGFIALSVTLVTGAFFVRARSDGVFFWQWQPKEVATLVAWVGFCALLNARFFAGWRGRRTAVLTMAGFGLLLVSFFTSFDAVAGGLR